MYYDLNIPCSFSPDRSAVDKLKLILSRLVHFNDCTAALNYTVQDVKQDNIKADIDLSGLNPKHDLTILKRVTIDTDNMIDNEDLLGLNDYDIIALKTRNIDLFERACVSLKVNIISFHFDERLSYELNPLHIKKAMERNVYFEICYAPTIKDQQTRVYTLQIAKQLYECTSGRYWILSSGSEAVSDIRNPSDIFYFAKSLGLPNDLAKFSVEKHCETVLKKAKTNDVI